ncbi:uncharacterized protein F5147DRAFT_697658, partial [Suillus discolor]
LMMTVSILGRGTAYREPKTGPASSVSDYDMRIGVWSCVSDDGRCGGGGDSSLCLRRLGLRRAIRMLCGIAIGRTGGARGSVPRFQWNYFHSSFSCTCVPLCCMREGLNIREANRQHTRLPLAYGTLTTAEGRSRSSISSPVGLPERRLRTQWKGRGREDVSWASVWNKEESRSRRMLGCDAC